MPQPDRLIQQAKAGNPDAIAGLINRKLNPKGITAEVHPQPNGVSILLWGNLQAPSQRSAIAYLTRAFHRLEARGIHRIDISGWSQGASQAVWHSAIFLNPENLAPAATTASQPIPPHPNTSSVAQRSVDSASPLSDSSQQPGNFNPVLFRLGWLLVSVPFAWLYFWLPQWLYSFDPTGDNPLQYWFDYHRWTLVIPLALGQWLLLQKYVRGAYWWAISTTLIAYLETYPRGWVSPSVFRLIYQLPGVQDSSPGFALSWLSNSLSGLVLGALMGLAQWLILRRSLRPKVATIHWIWISAIAWSLALGLPILVVRFGPNLAAFFPRWLWPLASVTEALFTGIGPFFFGVITAAVLAHWICTTQEQSPRSSFSSA